MLNPAHLHLIITHLPLLGSLFGLCLLIFGLWQRSHDIKQTSFWVFFLAGLAAVPAYLTGRPANELLMRTLPGLSADAGDQHAEVAVLALVAALVLGIVALGALVWHRKNKSLPSWFTALVLMLALATAGAMAWTANLGGHIRHPEIQGAAVKP